MKRSGFITLLTDFGLSDPYVAMMKGVILSINPDIRFVDITHQVETGSILQAASVIRETFPFFPRGTIHVVVVDPGVGSKRRPICLEADGHLFVGPDNGIFWRVIEEHGDRTITHLTDVRYFLPRITRTFHGRDVFAPAAAYLSLGKEPCAMGPVIKDPVELNYPKPRQRDDVLYGKIMHIDNFGNLITNIHRRDLDAFLDSTEPVISIGDLKKKGLSHVYSDVDSGEILALINSSDLLEIAVNLGRVSEYVGLDKSEIVGTEVKVSRYS